MVLNNIYIHLFHLDPVYKLVRTAWWSLLKQIHGVFYKQAPWTREHSFGTNTLVFSAEIEPDLSEKSSPMWFGIKWSVSHITLLLQPDPLTVGITRFYCSDTNLHKVEGKLLVNLYSPISIFILDTAVEFTYASAILFWDFIFTAEQVGFLR